MTHPAPPHGSERVLVAIAELIDEQGWPPTFEEIGERCGLESKSTVDFHVKRLELEGLIARPQTSSPRALRITNSGWRYLRRRQDDLTSTTKETTQ